MQPNEKMHPDDKRNLIIFGVLSILLWLSYDHFILGPKLEKMRAAQEVAQAQAVQIQTAEGMMDLAERPRNDIVKEASGKRISIDN